MIGGLGTAADLPHTFELHIHKNMQKRVIGELEVISPSPDPRSISASDDLSSISGPTAPGGTRWGKAQSMGFEVR